MFAWNTKKSYDRELKCLVTHEEQEVLGCHVFILPGKPGYHLDFQEKKFFWKARKVVRKTGTRKSLVLENQESSWKTRTNMYSWKTRKSFFLENQDTCSFLENQETSWKTKKGTFLLGKSREAVLFLVNKQKISP
jgi:hypothetical protein